MSVYFCVFYQTTLLSDNQASQRATEVSVAPDQIEDLIVRRGKTSKLHNSFSSTPPSLSKSNSVSQSLRESVNNLSSSSCCLLLLLTACCQCSGVIELHCLNVFHLGHLPLATTMTTRTDRVRYRDCFKNRKSDRVGWRQFTFCSTQPLPDAIEGPLNSEKGGGH